jgi:D-amino-acid dehydrogenase
MEVTSHKTPPRYNRVEGIIKAVNRYYPAASLKMPLKENIWYGYRPCSMDGLPYIGKTPHFANLTIATGHSMLGLSLGAATGKLVSELVLQKPTSMDLAPFSPLRS